MKPKHFLNEDECRLIEPALAREASFSTDDIQERLHWRQAQAWASEGSVAITEVFNHPLQKVLNLWLIGGDLKTILKHEDGVMNWAKTMGCKSAQMSGRVGWEKVVPEHWNKHSIIMKRSL